MTIIDCPEFEAGLAELLGMRDGGGGRLREALTRHAVACEDCRGALDLLEVAASPQASRDPIPDPGALYWSDFDRRLRARLDAGVPGPTRRSTRALSIAAAVAAIAAAVLAAVALHPWSVPSRPEIAATRPAPTPAPAPTPTPTPAPEGGAAVRSGFRSATPEPLPQVTLDAAGEDDAAQAFAMGARSDPFAESGDPALFPSVDDLTDEQKDRFADWLSLEEARVKRGAA